MFLCIVFLVSGIWSNSAFSQTDKEPATLGLPGDNPDLYAVLDLFQKSNTIEKFEKTINEEKTGINNLDLDKKVTMQIVGDKELYGKDYIVEPKAAASSASTANPGYTGSETVAMNIITPATVVVESSPVVVYMYSPAYVPYVPPYYYGYYPPYYNPMIVPLAIGIYHANHYYGPYLGGAYGNTVVIHNTNNYNNYNNSRNSSNTVTHNNANGNYNNNTGNRPSNTSANKAATNSSSRPSASPSSSTRPSSSTSARPSASPNTGGIRGSGMSRGGGRRR